MRLLLPGLLSAIAFGAEATPKTYDCPRVSGTIEIDGRLDDAAWKAAPWTDYFVDIEEDRKPQPRFLTGA